MKTVGIILTILGLVGAIYFGIQAMQESESFSLFGMDIAVSSANWTPVIVSAAVFIIGLVLMGRGKK